MRFSTVRLARGPALAYAEQGDAHGAAIILLHGWPDSWFSYSRVLPLLPPRYRALSLDQRGFGDSERPDSGYTVPDFADDVTGFCEAMGIARVTLVGHSFGSFVARRVAIAHADCVEKLVLIGAGFSAVNAVTREVQASIRNLDNPVSRAFAREFQSSTISLPLPDAFFEGIVDESVKLPARLWRDVFDGLLAYDDAADLGRIAAPTLLISGDRDAIFPTADVHRLAAIIPHATLTIYPETGHSPNWERPERVAADLVAFMEAKSVR
jgi:pimeloyl-ACP methyl ester carboxylesterase